MFKYNGLGYPYTIYGIPMWISTLIYRVPKKYQLRWFLTYIKLIMSTCS